MNLAALVSGGKDSVFALNLAKKAGHNIKAIIVMEPENPESYMFHYPNACLVEKQASLMDIPLVRKKTKGIKEKELDDLKKAIKKIKNIDGVVTGAVASNYQKTRIDNICKELSLESLAPLWNKDPENTIRDMLANDFEIIITAVGAPPLDETWLGRHLDKKCLDELIELNGKHGIHINGEGGEYETFVTDCPMFSKRIEIIESEKIWDEKTKSGILNIKKIKLFED
jgi:ABC transporter with metal-binding/Fe-S-binding domain ATP-binding protein